jgi:uncharacterized repeat protein (TIGR01451 family)
LNSKLLILASLFCLICHLSFAQSISINHQFQGTAFTNISKGNNKIGWVTYDTIQGSPFVYHYMDSLQNIVSTVDTNVKYMSRIGNGMITGGDHLWVTEMDPTGHLWGLFYDFTYFLTIDDSTSPNFQSCVHPYFLYDFDNHQRHYLNLGAWGCGIGSGSPYNYANSSISFLNDTLYITFENSDAFDSWTNIVKWYNGNIISVGKAGLSSVEVGFDHNSKLTFLNSTLTSNYWAYGMYQTLGFDTSNTQISYDQNVVIPDSVYPNSTSVKYDFTLRNNSTYIICNSYDINMIYPSVNFFIKMNNSFDTLIHIPLSGLPQYSAICVDHANRVWVWAEDSILMYDGTGWFGFSMQGYNPIDTTTNGQFYFLPTEITFIEYATNKFMINANKRGTSYYNGEVGNGIIFFTYSDTGSGSNALNHVQGKVFYDGNNNGSFDSGEFLMNNQIVTNSTIYTNVYPNGTYNIFLPGGQQNIITANALPYLTSVPAVHNLNFTTLTDTANVNFAMQHSSPTNDLRVDLTPGIHRTFQNIWYSLTYQSTGSSPANGTISIQYNPLMSFASSSLTPTTNTSGNLTWDFINLQPFESRQINFYLNPNNNFVIGDTVYAQASITPLVGDAIPSDNTDSTMSIFIGAYDPNMKVVTQNGAEVNTILNDDPLEYVIHFQNVGNDTAFTMVITDTISNLLDLSSLEIIGSSHTNYWGIYNRTLQFTFTSINLPDSGTNQLASNGFISYRIKPVASISMGNVINNTAAIYFDVNAPVITNNAQVTLIDVTSIKEEVPSLIKIVPNPAQQIIYIIGKFNQNQTANIYDAVGKVVLRSIVNNNQSIDISGLGKGIYFVELAGRRVKFVKE